MRFLTKAFVIVAALTALFASFTEGASSFNNAAATRTHLSNIRSDVQSNQEAVVSGIRSLSSFEFYSNSNNNNNNNPAGPPSTQCSQAVSAYSSTINAKCQSVISQIESIKTDSAMDTIINTQCSTIMQSDLIDCKAAIGATTAVQAACPDYNMGDIKASVTNIISVINGPMTSFCVPDDTDPSKYCLSTFFATFSAFTSDPSFSPLSLTDSFLSGLCKPCMETIVNKIASIGGTTSLKPLQKSLDFFHVMCNTDPTNPSQYCADFYRAFYALEKKWYQRELPTNADIAPLCTPCLKATIVRGANNHVVPISDLEDTERMCTKDPKSGNYCWSSVLDQIPSIASSLSPSCTPHSPSCAPACKTALQALYDQQCCVAIFGFKTIIASISQLESPLTEPFMKTFSAATKCADQIDISNNKCPPPAVEKLAVELSVPNIAFNAVGQVAISAGLKSALQHDLSVALGIDASAIIINGFTADPTNKGGVKVSITVSVDPSFKNGYIATLYQQLSQAGGLPLSNTVRTAQQHNAALVRGDPMSAMSVEGSSSGSQ